MKVNSLAETLLVEDGVTQISFNLSGTEAEYLLISRPNGLAETGEFFGHDHYVEVRDQSFGRYGGMAMLKVNSEIELEIELACEVPSVGHRLTITTQAPMPDSLLAHLRKLERR